MQVDCSQFWVCLGRWVGASMVCGVRHFHSWPEFGGLAGMWYCRLWYQHDDVEAHVKSLFPLNEMLVSGVHVDGSVIQNYVSASNLCRSQKGGSRVSMQVIAALFVSFHKKSWCLLLELFIQTSSWLQITLSYSAMFEKLPAPFIAPCDAEKTSSMCFCFLSPPFSPHSFLL